MAYRVGVGGYQGNQFCMWLIMGQLVAQGLDVISDASLEKKNLLEHFRL